jgi:hypothetical protein
MTDQPSHPFRNAKAGAAAYRAKAEAMRKRAASAGDLARVTLLDIAETYERLAENIEGIAGRHPFDPLERTGS